MSSTLILDPFCRRRPYLCCLDSAAFHDTFPRAPFVLAGSVEPIAGEFPRLSAHGEDESHPESFIDTIASEPLRTLSGQVGRLDSEALDEAPPSRVPHGIQGALARPRAASVPPPPGATMGNWQGYAGIRKSRQPIIWLGVFFRLVFKAGEDPKSPRRNWLSFSPPCLPSAQRPACQRRPRLIRRHARSRI